MERLNIVTHLKQEANALPDQNKISYPRLLRRVQAALIDSLIMPVILLIAIYIFGSTGVTNIFLKAIILIPIIIIEPIFISFTGGTIGHHILKLKVRRVDTDKKINFGISCIRFLLKLFLGWLSLITILLTKRHQAIHDLFLNTIVVNKSNKFLSNRESLTERTLEEAGYIYPTIIHKVSIIFLYWTLTFIVLAFTTVILQLINCTDSPSCELGLMVLLIIATYIWLFSLAFIVVTCWQAKLFGCRRKKL